MKRLGTCDTQGYIKCKREIGKQPITYLARVCKCVAEQCLRLQKQTLIRTSMENKLWSPIIDNIGKGHAT